MIDTEKLDCRIIDNGLRCKYLTSWRDGYKDEITRICTCKALNMIIFPDYKNEGKVNQKLMKVKPLFDCPVLQKLRMEGKAPQMMAIINKNNS